MKTVIGGIRIFSVILCIISVIFYNSPSYAQETPRISMDFQEVALKDVLKVFSQQAGLNFVATREIENKKVTLYLDGVTVQDALDSIMNANKLTYEQKPGSSVFVVKESAEPRVEMLTKVYTLNYARVFKGYESESEEGGMRGSDSQEDIKSVIENLLTKNDKEKAFGSVVTDVRTNSLIITSIPQDFALIESTLAKLDARTLQVMIEAEIVEVKTAAIKKLGLDWGGDTTGNFFTFTGPTRDTGFPFVRESGVLSRSLLGGSLADKRGRTLATSSTGNVFGNLSLAEFKVVLKALEKENKSKYLAKPKVMVINNETAEIKITADTAIGTDTTTETTTGTTSQSAEREETGVILKVTPTINKDGYITMTLEPEVSRVEVSNISASIFDPTKRSVKTTVMVKDGQTMAIGGLLKDETADNDRAVPGLSKIPLIGKLFQSKDFENTATEIIIFVTCHIVSTDLEDQEMVSQASELISKEQMQQAGGDAVTERNKEMLKAVKRLRKKRELE